MKVGADKFFVGDVERGRTDNSGDHFIATIEEILVVRRLGRAVGDNDSSLAGPTRTTRALRVVCRGRRHVAEIHCIERGNIDPQLHGGRTEKRRQELEWFTRELDFGGVFLEEFYIIRLVAEAPFPPFPQFL